MIEYILLTSIIFTGGGLMKQKALIITFFIILLSSSLYGEERGITLLAQQLGQNIQMGKQYLLIIGIDRYEKWMPLQNPVRDAKEIRDILVSRYFIDEVKELYNENATKAAIINAFRELQDTLELHDSLLIYYAGHGHLDKTTNTGFWIPVNAGTDDSEQLNWLPNIQIRGLLSYPNMKASHVCLISDSCFSGDILNTIRGKTPSPVNIPYFREAYKLTSRQVLTSGSAETVPDESEFSLQLKMALRKNTDPFVDPLMLYNQIRLGVSDTLPLLGSLKGTGHQEGAAFILFLKDTPVEDTGEEPDLRENIHSGLEEKITPVEETEEKKPARLERNYISTGAGFGIFIPLGEVSDFFEPGYYPITFFSYNLRFNWGIIGIGIVSGTEIDMSTQTDTGYDLYTIPVAGSFRYATDFGVPLYGFIEATGGGTLNLMDSNNPDETNKINIKLYAGASAGIGYHFVPGFSISLYGNYTAIFFSDALYMGITPGMRCEFNF